MHQDFVAKCAISAHVSMCAQRDETKGELMIAELP